MVEASIPPEAQDVAESSWAKLWSTTTHPPEREAYVTVDALKNFMSVMTDTIMRQVSEQVQRAIEVADLARPLSPFGYVSTTGYEPPTSLRVYDPLITLRGIRRSRS